MLAERLLEQFPVDRLVLRTRVNEIAVAQEVDYRNLSHKYLDLSVKISVALKLPYHEEMAETRERLGGCCYRNRVDLFIDTYGGEDKEKFKLNNFRIADIAFLTHSKGMTESILKRIEDGSFSRAELKIAGERLAQLEENLYLGLQHVYTVNGIEPKENKDVLYNQVFDGVVSDDIRRNIEIGRVIYKTKDSLFGSRITDIYAILGNLSMQVRDTR